MNAPDWFGMGLHEPIAFDYYDALRAATVPRGSHGESADVKREAAIAWLRERGRYCLDQQQPKIPPKECPQTVLSKWLKERHK